MERLNAIPLEYRALNFPAKSPVNLLYRFLMTPTMAKTSLQNTFALESTISV
jgi:hypothetical protein